MKVFVSWSGDLSRKIAEALKKWPPSLINEVNVFFSPEDIEKGENWDNRISKELSECNYGIVCLTSDNVSAPWLNFEAGAIARSLDSRVSALLVNINPSDIKGPLSRYQATKLLENDFRQLVGSINKHCQSPLDSEVLSTSFDGLWSKIHESFEEIISSVPDSVPPESNNGPSKAKKGNPDAVEEILQLLRQQSNILSSPSNLLPPDYFEFLNRETSYRSKDEFTTFIIELLDYLNILSEEAINNSELAFSLKQVGFFERICDRLYVFRKRISKSDRELAMYIDRFLSRINRIQ